MRCVVAVNQLVNLFHHVQAAHHRHIRVCDDQINHLDNPSVEQELVEDEIEGELRTLEALDFALESHLLQLQLDRV